MSMAAQLDHIKLYANGLLIHDAIRFFSDHATFRENGVNISLVGQPLSFPLFGPM